MDTLAYSIKDAAKASGIGRTTLYALIKDKQLTPVKIGGRTLIRRSDLTDLLERSLAAWERAYRRGDAIEKRRMMMAQWSKFLTEIDEGAG